MLGDPSLEKVLSEGRRHKGHRFAFGPGGWLLLGLVLLGAEGENSLLYIVYKRLSLNNKIYSTVEAEEA